MTRASTVGRRKPADAVSKSRLVYSASLFAIKSGLTPAFPLAPRLIALLKGAAFLYPHDQRRVDEIERDLVAPRAATATSIP